MDIEQNGSVALPMTRSTAPDCLQSERSLTRVKFCGITRPGDGIEAARLGADAIGLVFYPPSPRAVGVEQARAIRETLPPFVTVVGLFVNAEPHDVREVIDAVSIDLLQFHGEESPLDCELYGKPYIKAVSMRPGIDVTEHVRRYDSASALLLDTHHADLWGGTGQPFEWTQIPKGLRKPIVLAGGLTPENVASAIQKIRPFAVDVSGGVESAKGIKDARKMSAFIRGVQQCHER